MTKKSFSACILSVGVFLVLAGTTYFIKKEPPAPKQVSQKQGSSTTADAESGNLSFQAERTISDDYVRHGSKYGSLPRSLRDTEIDGRLDLDNEGNLIVTQGIRQLFDYFLSAQGEEPIETIIGRIEEYVRQMLPADAAVEALAILDKYLLYNQGLNALEKEVSELNENNSSDAIDLTRVKQVLDKRRELRRKNLPLDVVDAFFGDEEQYEQFTMTRLEVQENPDLPEKEKIESIVRLIEQYPQEITKDWRDSEKRKSIDETLQTMRKEGARAEETHHIREEAFGKEAADRLAALDEERSKWDLRMESYMGTREKILLSTELTVQEKEDRIDRLRQESFTERELLRVDVLERIYKKSDTSS